MKTQPVVESFGVFTSTYERRNFSCLLCFSYKIELFSIKFLVISVKFPLPKGLSIPDQSSLF
jgi:hypothetical protein